MVHKICAAELANSRSHLSRRHIYGHQQVWPVCEKLPFVEGAFIVSCDLTD